MGAKPCSRLSAEAGVLSWGRPKASQDDFWPRTCFCSTIHQLVLLVRHGDPLLVLLPQVWGRSCPPQVPGREAWHGELGWIHLSEALSGLPLSTSNHLEGRWLGQAGCLCSCCAPWGEAGPLRGADHQVAFQLLLSREHSCLQHFYGCRGSATSALALESLLTLQMQCSLMPSSPRVGVMCKGSAVDGKCCLAQLS